jgi:hypothetical protein
MRMPAPNASRRAAVRTLVVVALSLFAIFAAACDLRRLWVPIGSFGYGTDLDGVVTAIDDGSPAARAGMALGDRVIVTAADRDVSWFIIQIPSVQQPGDRVALDLLHQGEQRTVTLTSVPEPLSSGDKFVLVLAIIAAVIVSVIGAAVVLLRPSLGTWGFFFFCINTAVNTIYPWVLYIQDVPYPLCYTLIYFGELLTGAGLAGLLAFSLQFLHEHVGGWRRFGLRSLPFFFVVFTIVYVWQSTQTYLIGGPPANMLGSFEIALTWLVSLVALYAFVETYVRARGADRQRIQWVVIGFALSLLSVSVSQFLVDIFTDIPAVWLAAVGLLQVAAPFSFAYAIVRHRVIDVSFVMNRALVYGVLTTLLVGVFSLIDWFFTGYLQLARLGTLAEVGSVVAFGMWFNGLHRRVDSLVDATFFRQRHRAESQLARNAAALPFATSSQVVAHALVAEPMRTLELASAALFRKQLDGRYAREAAEGWKSSDVSTIDETDGHFLMLLQAENGALSLFDHPWRVDDMPKGAGRPILAVPIIVRHEVAAVAFCSRFLWFARARRAARSGRDPIHRRVGDGRRRSIRPSRSRRPAQRSRVVAGSAQRRADPTCMKKEAD